MHNSPVSSKQSCAVAVSSKLPRPVPSRLEHPRSLIRRGSRRGALAEYLSFR